MAREAKGGRVSWRYAYYRANLQLFRNGDLIIRQISRATGAELQAETRGRPTRTGNGSILFPIDLAGRSCVPFVHSRT